MRTAHEVYSENPERDDALRAVQNHLTKTIRKVGMEVL